MRDGVGRRSESVLRVLPKSRERMKADASLTILFNAIAYRSLYQPRSDGAKTRAPPQSLCQQFDVPRGSLKIIYVNQRLTLLRL